MPPVREREPEPIGVDHLAGRLAPEQPALEHVLLAAATGLPYPGRTADRPLVLEEPFEDVDRRPERRDGRAVLDLAVPAAIRELLPEEPLNERRHVDAEVRPGGDDVAVDARLDLASKKRWSDHGVSNSVIRQVTCSRTRPIARRGLVARGVEPEQPQQLQRRGTCPYGPATTVRRPTCRPAPGARAAGRPSPRSRPSNARRRRRRPARASGRA